MSRRSAYVKRKWFGGDNLIMISPKVATLKRLNPSHFPRPSPVSTNSPKNGMLNRHATIFFTSGLLLDDRVRPDRER
jgi:hypothetical protein